MALLGLVNPAPAVPEPAVKGTTELQLRMEDVLASRRRVWVRGQLTERSAGRWWDRLLGKADPAVNPQHLHLESRISSHIFEANVPVLANGQFEATFVADLAAPRRGWRVARHRVQHGERSAEKCSVMLMPPEEATAVLVVVLPLSFTWPADGIQRLAESVLGGQLTAMLRRFEHGPSGQHAIYYLGCVPQEGNNRHVELALATTTLGWPTGNYVLLNTTAQDALAKLAGGLDRLRWLFADTLDLVVLNLEPTAQAVLAPSLVAAEDRATVRKVFQPDEDPWAACAGKVSAPTRASQPRPARGGLVPRHPVVFCHGMLAFSRLRMQLPEEWNYFIHLREFLRQRGVEALYPQVAPTSGVADRAEQLRDLIRRWTDEPINLVAHSMGGLDARYLIAHLGMAKRVVSLTTIATPHHGSHVADWFEDAFRERLPLVRAFEALGVNMDGFRACRPAACHEFNATTPNAPSVRYSSYAAEVAAARVSPALRRTWKLLHAVEGPNDGLVSVCSARWGECRGVLRADHFAQTPDGVFLRPGEDFDALGFYARLIEDLARSGL